MKQSIPKILMLGLGLAGLAGAGWVITSMIKEDPDRSGSGLVRSPIKTRRAKVYQRPTQVAVGGESTGINFSSIGARTAADLELENLDPGKAGWDTELQSDAAARALTLIFDKDGGDKPINEDFRGTPLRPDLVEIYSSDGIQVRRLQGRQPGDEVRTLDKIGFLKALPKQHGTRKIIRIAQEGDEGDFSTRVIASTHDESLVGQWHQTTSVWDCNWAFSALEPDELPLLKRLTLLSHEEVIRTGKKPLFEDVAGNVLPEKIGPHDSPVTDWARTLTKIDDMHFAGHHGIAIGDANGDGLDDLYVCDCGGLPNRLYLQNPEGTTRDISAQAGVDWLESSKSALFLDLDNDGDQDLVVATVALVLVLENNGQASFSLRSRIPGMSNPHSLSAADYDSDGDLDLFVCNYGADSVTGGLSGSIAGPPLPFNDAENGGRNALLRNDGNLQFSDVTSAAGIAGGGDRWSFAASWEDYDNDGDQDLYVANDFGRNNLFRNDAGRFTDVAAAAGVEDISSGMSVAWSDANRDGRMDVYVSNMFSSAGGRVAFQRQFGKGNPGATADFQRMARGNTLFLGGNSGKFDDASVSAGVNVGLWAWSSQFADLNNDGWQDLVVANGYLTNQIGGPDL
ncbi:VCBS repeat-containing protein [bacterium]|nr:VCBS repeat-containing protein [Akkermansiaceae bacterium]MDA7609765.1 VCBS repeat-containing protein [bacterium]MDA7522597.1 VCBS repeat-containing protein [Akkermansiaceae bacterium]MDA7526767.1 VCBS repeat-containing protein [Akkermansiaceae bacterium]MDA7531652.1 VCBS repeat-containing protein [Akkermansiaceae bacterium]